MVKQIRGRRSAKSNLPSLKNVSFEGVAELFTSLEAEAQKLLRRVIDLTERSSRDLKKSVSDLVDQVRNQGLYNLASEKKEDLRLLAEEIVGKVKGLDLSSLTVLNGGNRDKIVREARKNIEEIVERVSSSELFSRAKEGASKTKSQIFSILSIPSEGEIKRLSEKISSLEQRVNRLTKKAA